MKTTQNTPWTLDNVKPLFNQPFNDLLFQAHTVHRAHFNPNHVQISTLLNIKTGSCPENCSYCPQSAHFKTDITKEPLLRLTTVREAAKKAKAAGASRFCMGAAWRGPKDADLDSVCDMVKEIKKLGLESCVTLGMLKPGQAEKLKAAGVDFYNHNIDTSPEYYREIITSHSFNDRLNTLELARKSGIKLCCGGILGMGETNEDRMQMLIVLANLPQPPESVPLNKLIPIPGTPLGNRPPLDTIEFIRTIALARIMMPTSHLRFSAGRGSLSDEAQALGFFAGINSIHYGELLLTTKNPAEEKDNQLFENLGLKPEPREDLLCSEPELT